MWQNIDIRAPCLLQKYFKAYQKYSPRNNIPLPPVPGKTYTTKTKEKKRKKNTSIVWHHYLCKQHHQHYTQHSNYLANTITHTTQPWSISAQRQIVVFWKTIENVAFKVAPNNPIILYSDRESVSFRLCVRSVWLPGKIRTQMAGGSLPFTLLPRRDFPFPLCGRAFFSHVKSKWGPREIHYNSKWNQTEFEVNPKWNRSEVELTSKWNRSELEVSSK